MKKKLFLAFAALLFAVSMNATSVSLSFDNRVGHFNDFENSLKVSSDVEGCDVRPAVVWIYKEGTLVYVYTLKGNDNVYFTLSDFFAKMDEVNDKFEGFEDGVEYSVKFSYSRMGNVYVNAAKQGQECDVEFLYNGEKHTIKDFDVSSYNTTDITINTIWELWQEIELTQMRFTGLDVTAGQTVKEILDKIKLPEEAATANLLSFQNMSIGDVNGVALKEDDVLMKDDTFFVNIKYKGAEKTFYDKLKADMSGSSMTVSYEDGFVLLSFRSYVSKSQLLDKLSYSCMIPAYAGDSVKNVVKHIEENITVSEEALANNHLTLVSKSLLKLDGSEFSDSDLFDAGDSIVVSFKYKGDAKYDYSGLKADMCLAVMEVDVTYEDECYVTISRKSVVEGVNPLYFTGLKKSCEGMSVKDVSDAIVVPTDAMEGNGMKVKEISWSIMGADENLADDYVFVKGDKVSILYMCSYSSEKDYSHLITKMNGNSMSNGKVSASIWYIEYDFEVEEAVSAIHPLPSTPLVVVYAKNGKVDCEGENTRIFDANGLDVTSSNGSLSQGIYVVECDNVRTKVIMR